VIIENLKKESLCKFMGLPRQYMMESNDSISRPQRADFSNEKSGLNTILRPPQYTLGLLHPNGHRQNTTVPDYSPREINPVVLFHGASECPITEIEKH